jgi:hypothetical protein
MHPPISAADLLRAFAAIRPKTDEERRAIAGMLGFDSALPATSNLQAVASEASEDRQGEKASKPLPLRQAPLAPRTDAALQTGRIRISGPRAISKQQLDWLHSVPALRPGSMGRAHNPAPLFRPQWTRAILAASLSVRRHFGPADLARAVETIARGAALQALPRHPIMTLAHGVQALLDISESMQPFDRDRAALCRDLKRIVGDGNLEVLQFLGTPHKARRDDSCEWQDYETNLLPHRDTCILIVSDFGIGRAPGLARGASRHTWSILAERLARRGHRFVGFVPYPPARWPSFLGRAVNLVQWDRTTTVGRISLSRPRDVPA